MYFISVIRVNCSDLFMKRSRLFDIENVQERETNYEKVSHVIEWVSQGISLVHFDAVMCVEEFKLYFDYLSLCSLTKSTY